MLLQTSMSTATRRKQSQTAKSTPLQMRRPPVRRPSTVELDETLGLLALSCIKGVGYWTLRKIRQEGHSFAKVVSESNEEQVRCILKDAGAQLAKTSQNNWSSARDAIVKRAQVLRDDLAGIGTRVVHHGSPEYPLSLGDLADPPFWLFVQGRLEVLNRPAVTVVGTRSPSDDGLWLARFVGECLHELKCPTISGLAAGIDQLVHQASIRARVPTVAVLGAGILSDYPRGGSGLRSEIVARGGVVVTEYLPKQSYSAENFVRRNRLQAALGRVLVPVEWAAKSGTAHTVKYAADLGRPVACLRMPDWADAKSPFGTVSTDNKQLFTIPGQEKPFRQYISKALKVTKGRRTVQRDLFASE